VSLSGGIDLFSKLQLLNVNLPELVKTVREGKSFPHRDHFLGWTEINGGELWA